MTKDKVEYEIEIDPPRGSVTYHAHGPVTLSITGGSNEVVEWLFKQMTETSFYKDSVCAVFKITKSKRHINHEDI